MTRDRARKLRMAALMVAAALVTAACNSATVKKSKATPARIETPDEYSFTITERARIGSNVRSDYDRAIALLEQGNAAEGIELLEQVAATAPNLSAPHIDLGVAYHRAGNLEAAEKNLKLALEANPSHPTAHNELGIIYRKTARFADARRSYEAALQIYPGYHYARRNLGVLCDLYLADAQCALENYEAYMNLVHGDPEVEMWLTALRYRIGDTEAQ
ncbi:MAG: tetratricopeptide repeat protein [Woeseiaceae bacterium]|nr:tetratricopeptide repeat protein [Woeseiaceae bacterium]